MLLACSLGDRSNIQMDEGRVFYFLIKDVHIFFKMSRYEPVICKKEPKMVKTAKLNYVWAVN